MPDSITPSRVCAWHGADFRVSLLLLIESTARSDYAGGLTNALTAAILMIALSFRGHSKETSGRCVCIFSYLHVHSATASVLELRPSALRSELAFRALRVSDSSPLAGSGSLSKNFFSCQRGHAATWEQRTFAPIGMCPD